MRRFHGTGRLDLANGFHYTGQFFYGHPHGLGEAVYTCGSTFSGIFKKGLKCGSGGTYVCAITGIKFTGEWKEDKVASPASKFAIEVAIRDEDSKSDKRDAKKRTVKSSAGTRGAKVKGVPRGVNQQVTGENQPVVARYESDGSMVDLWCRCVRDSRVRSIYTEASKGGNGAQVIPFLIKPSSCSSIFPRTRNQHFYIKEAKKLRIKSQHPGAPCPLIKRPYLELIPKLVPSLHIHFHFKPSDPSPPQ